MADVTYAPDPGGNFASDAHRRVMAHLPNPGDDPIPVESLVLDGINTDPHTLKHFKSVEQVAAVLEDLAAEGYAEQLDDGWVNTESGFDVLTSPPVAADADSHPALLTLEPASANGDAAAGGGA